MDECHLAFCCALDSPLNRVAAQIGCAELGWERLEGSLVLLKGRWVALLKARWACVDEQRPSAVIGCMLVLPRRLHRVAMATAAGCEGAVGYNKCIILGYNIWEEASRDVLQDVEHGSL